MFGTSSTCRWHLGSRSPADVLKGLQARLLWLDELCKLQFEQPAVCSALCEKLVVSAALRDFSTFNDMNQVSMKYAGETMRNHESGSSLRELSQLPLNDVLSLAIERRGWLVQENDGCVLEISTSKSYPLARRSAPQVRRLALRSHAAMTI